MNLGIKNKRALVTGAGRGIGRSIAYNLASEGVKVAVVSRTEKDLDELLIKIGGKKKGHYKIAADLVKEESPVKVTNKLFKEFGKPDIVVNNLGGNLNIKDPYCSVEDWRKIWRLNMEVAIEINNIVIPHMKSKGWGRIVNISSISALENQGTLPYCAIKAALTAYSRSLGRILSPFGIVMTSVLPGAVFTEEGYWGITQKTKPEYIKKYIEERMAIKRLGRPDEIGAIVAFLCSDQASFCIGSAVPVDGGQGRCLFQ